MSEAEVHILKQRMDQGKLHKARRGERRFPVPIGSMRDAAGQVVFDPDEQVQHVVRLIFRKFDEIGTLHGSCVTSSNKASRWEFGSEKGQPRQL